jgi:hypothetical protein
MIGTRACLHALTLPHAMKLVRRPDSDQGCVARDLPAVFQFITAGEKRHQRRAWPNGAEDA